MNQQHESLATLHLRLWEATNAALDFPCSGEPSLEREDVTHISIQLGRLVRMLARRGICPIDETQAPSSHEEV